jgi:hypothetical protein
VMRLAFESLTAAVADRTAHRRGAWAALGRPESILRPVAEWREEASSGDVWS